MKQKISSAWLLLLAFLMLGGCASMQPLSHYARTGDTVAISLGGTEYNALVPVLTKDNISISITDSGGNTYPVKLRNVLRIYADPTSVFEYNNLKTFQGFPYEGKIRPHQGLWIAFVDLVDPSSDQPHALLSGLASLSVSSADIQNWVDTSGVGWTGANGNLSNIPIEILPGTGVPNPLNYIYALSFSPTDRLEAAEQLEIRPSGVPSSDIGGALFKVQFTNSSFTFPPRVATTTPDPNVQVGSSIQDQGDGTSLLTILVTNPHGFVPTNARDDVSYHNGNGGKSLYDSLRFSIFWVDEEVIIDNSNWQNHIDLASAEFTDVNGSPMPELSASVVKVK